MDKDQRVNETLRMREFVVDKYHNELDKQQKDIATVETNSRKAASVMRNGKKKMVRYSDYSGQSARQSEVDDLVFCGAALVTEMLGIKTCRKEKEPFSKRLDNQLIEDLSRLNMFIEKKKNMKIYCRKDIG